jgi:methionyl-tRNA formyltransferase
LGEVAVKIALFGQAAFGKEVLERLLEAGHQIVGVYAPPEGGRSDPLAEEAQARGLPLFRYKRMRRKGRAIPELVEEHAALEAELNVLAYVTMILPPEVVAAPRRGSLCFHPSLLPRFRGGAATAWQIILGERESAVTVFHPDEGIDTGPIVVQKGGVEIGPTATAASLYYQELYPLGVEALCEAVALVDQGEAELRPQDESQATFQGLVDDAVARVDWSRPCEELDRLIRGCDPQPGAFAERRDQTVRLFDAARVEGVDGKADAPAGTIVAIEEGRLVIAAEGGRISVGRVRIADGKKVPAGEAGLAVGERLG